MLNSNICCDNLENSCSEASTVFLIPAKLSSNAMAVCAALNKPTDIAPIAINDPPVTAADLACNSLRPLEASLTPASACA